MNQCTYFCKFLLIFFFTEFIGLSMHRNTEGKMNKCTYKTGKLFIVSRNSIPVTYHALTKEYINPKSTYMTVVLVIFCKIWFLCYFNLLDYLNFYQANKFWFSLDNEFR